MAIGERLHASTSEKYPKILHRTWDQIIRFIFKRFQQFGRVKTDNEQWDTPGKVLWELYINNGTFESFATAVRRKFGLARATNLLAGALRDKKK